MDDDVIKMRFEALEKCIFANGRPGLEDRMRAESRELVSHKMNNITQIFDLKFGNLERVQDERHEENQKRMADNGKKIDRMTWLVGIGFGLVLAANLVIPHIWK